MQRQQEREPAQGRPARKRRRLSWGELLAGWLLVVGGGLALVATVAQVPEYLRRDPGGVLPVFVLLLLQSGGGFLGGLSSLLRYRTAARLLLPVAALCSVGVAVWIAYQEYLSRRSHNPPNQLIEIALLVGAFLALASLLYFLGWWLGRQEDSEA